MATSLNNLAVLYQCHGPVRRGRAALPPQPGDPGEAKLGPDHPDVAASLNNLAVLSAAQGRWAEAAESIDRARRVVRRHVARVLPALAEAEQLDLPQGQR